MIEGMGKSPETLTGTLRDFRDTVYSSITPQPFQQSQETMARLQDKTTLSLLGTPSPATALDVPIGIIKGGESLINPKAITAQGALAATALSTKTNVNNDPLLRSFIGGPPKATPYIGNYFSDIAGREKELIGESLFDIGASIVIGKVVSNIKVGNLQENLGIKTGSKADQFLLEKSSRYRNSVESALRERPNLVGQWSSYPDEVVAPNSPYAKAIDDTFDLEQTVGTSAITRNSEVVNPDRVKAVPQYALREVDETGKIIPKQGDLTLASPNPEAPFVSPNTIKDVTLIKPPVEPTSELSITKNLIGQTKGTVTESYFKGSQKVIVQGPIGGLNQAPKPVSGLIQVTKQTSKPINVELAEQVLKTITYGSPYNKVRPLVNWGGVLGYAGVSITRELVQQKAPSITPQQANVIETKQIIKVPDNITNIENQTLIPDLTRELPSQETLSVPSEFKDIKSLPSTTSKITLPPREDQMPTQEMKNISLPKTIPIDIAKPILPQRTDQPQIVTDLAIPDVAQKQAQATIQDTAIDQMYSTPTATINEVPPPQTSRYAYGRFKFDEPEFKPLKRKTSTINFTTILSKQKLKYPILSPEKVAGIKVSNPFKTPKTLRKTQRAKRRKKR